MPSPANLLTDFILRQSYADLPEPIRHQAKRCRQIAARTVAAYEQTVRVCAERFGVGEQPAIGQQAVRMRSGENVFGR